MGEGPGIVVNVAGAEGLGSVVGAALNLSCRHFLAIVSILIGAGITTYEDVIGILERQLDTAVKGGAGLDDRFMLEHSIALARHSFGPRLVAVDGGKQD